MQNPLLYYGNVCKREILPLEYCFYALHTYSDIMIHNVCTECLISMEEVATDNQPNDTVMPNHPLVATQLTSSVHQEISQPEGD